VTTGLPNKTLQRTAATGIALPGRDVTVVAAAAELGRSALGGAMSETDAAVLAIRHVVQDHPDEGTRLGDRTDIEPVRWFGQLLGWVWPPSYLNVLSRHNGVMVQHAILFGFVESIEVFLLYHQSWHRVGYWPVASDGCGNYFVLALKEQGVDGECPVIFIDTIASAQEPAYTVAVSYARFVRAHMQEQCNRSGCRALAEQGAAADRGNGD
jgi:hypothetical protein